MTPTVTRRRLLALSVGGLAGMAGCQSFSVLDSPVPIQIHVLNTTDENLEVWVQLTSPDVDDPLGESLLMESGMVERLEVTVPKARYQLRIIVDDTTPRLEKTVQWEVTRRDCAKQSYATVISSETELALQVVTENCEQT